jgi:peptidoglycan/xylan/chitin deacetylase (PgdA/CDA1 family)
MIAGGGGVPRRSLLVTTSWDDGSVLDLRIAELLDRHGAKGTFYVPRSFDGQTGKYAAYDRRLSEAEMRQLARDHEIGSHSLTHRRLAGAPEPVQRHEIVDSRSWLEDALGGPVSSFCYPGGSADTTSIRLVREAGYRCGRTCELLRFDLPEDPFRMPVSLHAAPFPFRKVDQRQYYWRRILEPLRNYGWGLLRIPGALVQSSSWHRFARAAVPGAGVFHLFGHSWEIERYGMWSEIGELLEHLGTRSGVEFLTNAELAERMRDAHPAGQR